MKLPTLRARGFVLPTRIQNAGSAYEGGAATGSRAKNWNPSSAGPNSAATASLPTLRRRSRDAVRNDPWAKTAGNRWVSNVIGTGIQPYSRHPDKAVREMLKQMWADWVPEADADGRLDFYGLQALAVRSMFNDGETLLRLRPRRPQDGLTVPLQLQALEGDHLPVEDTYSTATGEVVNGVEFDRIGRRVLYHLWSRHPDEPGGSTYRQKRPVPADQVIHAYPVLRPGQVRGVPELATVLLRLKTLDNFDDAVAFRQEVSNLFAGFIIKPSPTEGGDNPLTDDVPEYDDDDTPIASLEPGSMHELNEGQDVRFASPPGAPENYDEFMRQQLMAAFASVGIPYEIATGDLRGISDRTLRVLVNEFHRLIEQFQWTCFIHQWCRPVWNAWVEMLVLAGEISPSDYVNNRRHWQRVLWVPEGWPYFNPVQDVKAKTDEIRSGLTSRSEVILAKGNDPEDVMAQIAHDTEQADALGLVFDSDGRHPKTGSKQPIDNPVDSPSDQTIEQ
ncbi:phage portal protein [Orrella marina]|uniref:Phage portal protein n=1 Tax=Orrella marina TaxID=2163011 RepID=A0A2R4XF21_9BURK|nr:phage portal protein [Orrella marina]AWB32371.1 phage portal protein [Orrella marina]